MKQWQQILMQQLISYHNNDDDMHDDSVQLQHHNMATDTNGNVEDNVPIHTGPDHTKTTLDHT